MTIEVRQMLIKSTVLPEGVAAPKDGAGNPALDEIREEILEDCRRLVIEILRGEDER